MKTLQSIVSERIDGYYNSLKSIAESGSCITQTESDFLKNDIDYLEAIDFYNDANNLRALLSSVKVRDEIYKGICNVN